MAFGPTEVHEGHMAPFHFETPRVIPQAACKKLNIWRSSTDQQLPRYKLLSEFLCQAPDFNWSWVALEISSVQLPSAKFIWRKTCNSLAQIFEHEVPTCKLLIMVMTTRNCNTRYASVGLQETIKSTCATIQLKQILIVRINFRSEHQVLTTCH